MNKQQDIFGLCFTFVGLLLASASCANALGADAGDLRPSPGQHPAVHLVKETIRVFTYTVASDPRYYRVTVDAIFQNVGLARHITMCIPENDLGAYSGSSRDAGLADVVVSVDGRHYRVKRRVVNASQVELPNQNALWVTDVFFRRGQAHHVKTQYRSMMWGSCATALTYSFAGSRWRGPVRRTEIITNADAGSAYYDPGGTASLASIPKNPYRTRKSVNFYQWKNWQNKGAISIG